MPYPGALAHVLRTSIDFMKEKGFSLKIAKPRDYAVESTTNVLYADDLALLTKTFAQAESI